MKAIDENFVYGYNEAVYNLRTSYHSDFKCYYARAKYIPTSFKEECVNVCKKISDYAISKNKIPYILFSGGLDSEIVVRAFVDSGRPFQTITNRFLYDLNKHEIDYVEKVCKKLNIDPFYVDVDIEKWLVSDEAYHYATDSKCTHAEMLPTMKLMNDVYFEKNGVPVLGNGDLYVSKDINPEWRMNQNGKKYQWNYVEFEYIVAWYRYAVKNNILGGINFFQHTPEIVLSMALDPLIQRLVLEEPIGKQSSRSAKYQVYRKYWPEIELRSKYHGSEMIAATCDFINKSKLYEFNDYTSKWKLPFLDFIECLKPNEYSYKL